MSQLKPLPLLPKWQQEALRSIHQQRDLGGLANSGRILHYGCGGGHAIRAVPQAVGFEPNLKLLQQQALQNSNIVTSEDNLQGTFDIVFCHERMSGDAAFEELLGKLSHYTHRNSTLILGIDRTHPAWCNDEEQLKAQINPLFLANGYRLVGVETQYVPKSRQMLLFYRIFGMSFYDKIITLLGWLKKDKRFLLKAIPI